MTKEELLKYHYILADIAYQLTRIADAEERLAKVAEYRRD